MTEQQYRVIADRDKGDQPGRNDYQQGDRLVFSADRPPSFTDDGLTLVRIERPVPTTDEPQKPELVTLHLYRDTCVGGLFLSEREIDRTLHEHVEALAVRRDRLPSPSVPTREQIVEVLSRANVQYQHGAGAGSRSAYLADAVLALLTVADR